jgi:tetratricopeptide (TPR) repeat protein
MLNGTKIKPAVLGGFKKGFMGGFNFTDQMIKNNVKYKFMDIRTRKGQTYALFRMLSGEGCNYHEYLLIKRSGKVVTGDIYVLLSGEYLSKTVGRTSVPALLRASQGAIKKLFSKEADLIKYDKEMKQLINSCNRGDADSVFKAYNKLPESLKKDKLVLILRFRAAAMKGIESPEYKSVIADMQKYYPNDACLNFIMVDSYFLNGKFDKVRESLEYVKKFVGKKDAYIMFLEGNTYMAQKKYEQAIEKQNEAIKTEPTLDAPYFSLISIYLQEKNWKEVVNTIERAEKALNLVFDNMENVPDYSEFLKSKEYKDWKKTRKKPQNK